MEKTSTPLSNLARGTLNPKNDSGPNSPFDISISPIKKKKQKSQSEKSADLDHGTRNEATLTFSDELKNSHHASINHNHEDDGMDNIVGENDCKDGSDLEGFSNHSDESDGLSNYSSSLDRPLDDVEINTIKETLSEIRGARLMNLKKIKRLDISVEWELPKTLQPKKGIYRATEGLKGPLDYEEVAFIKKRLKQFCKEYNISNSELRLCLAEKVTKFCFPNDLRLKFIQYICKDFINERHPLSVFRTISKIGLRKGRFSKKEVQFLIEMYHNYTGSQLHSICGLFLNRHRSHIIKKFERLKKRDLLGPRPSVDIVHDDLWKLQNSILENVLERKCFNLAQLKRHINLRTWISIGSELNVSPAIAKAIYTSNLMPQIFATHPVNFRTFFKKLIQSISMTDNIEWEQVPWKKLSNSLNDVGPFFVYVMLRKIVIHFVPKEKWRKFDECAEYLNREVLPLFEGENEQWKKRRLNQIVIRND